MKDELLIQEMLNQSVRFGGIYLPSRSLQTALGNYCTNLCVWTHYDECKVQLLGTAIPVFYRNRYLLVCTGHQLRNVDAEDVCLLYPDGSISVTSSGVRGFNPTAARDSDACDIAAFDFTEAVNDHQTLREGFLSFSMVPPNVRSNEVVALITAGYPSSEQVYDLSDNNHLGLVKRNLTAQLDGKPADDALVRARFVKKLDFNPDGMSGAPVFVVQIEGGQLSAYLAGMIVRAGKERCYFLKIGYIKAFLDSFLNEA
ncbi:hypothetical protein [Leisingera caerulea]|uniref:hypothetical protein n=1 Tax=Leisingera caerulea TaxID=506591 RepID=UPI0021A7C4D2|nr:hypothetical protein [Leisingera caerulea]UWQ84745.1 hypothetical protein K3726_05965 [Leisingera caerulea]